ncbi:hypothetical protein N0V85_001887 [Neurospora sp. IMI 360204]|nr:hypothetical protein N0V85_001887 [Neurospora sp. IMI 360204]
MSKNEPMDNLALMKLWIENCRENHVKCSENLTRFLPTRLLDIRAFEHQGSQDIKLVCLSPSDYGSDKQDAPSYVTLSHCCGPPEKRPATTTKANLQERMTRIRFDELPNTFRDAVRITRELDPSLRYLWIDSLCIVQDDTEDWAREASLMAHVYSQSFITLVALSSSDSSQGCNIVDDIQEKVGTMIDLDLKDSSTSDTGEPSTSTSTRIRVTQYKPQPWSEHYADYGYSFFTTKQIPLRWRAWVLQERELSRRSIHFGAEQLLWECHELKATAQLPWLNEEQNSVPSIQSRFMRTASDLIENPLATTMKHRWFLLAEDYSVRQLTQETDKLPALSGVAQSYQQYFGPREKAVYLAGTWSTHLPDALLWATRQPSDDSFAIRASTYIAPSWSWTSVRTPISYSSLRLKDVPSAVADTSSITPKPYHPTNKVLAGLKVEAMRGTPKYPDPYGALIPNGSYLALTGARLVTIDGFAPPLTRYGDQDMAMNDLVILRGGEMAGVLHPDVRRDVDIERYNASTSEQRPLVCLALMGESERGETERPSIYHDLNVGNGELVMGLVLRRRGNGEDGYGYERVGLARWMRLEVFREVGEGVVKLV